MNTIFLAGFAAGLAFGAGILQQLAAVPHIHCIQLVQAAILYLPGPDVNNATAVTKRINGICICIHTRPIAFIATSIMITTKSEAKRVNKPTINNVPARISATTTIQNHVVRDKKVNPSV